MNKCTSGTRAAYWNCRIMTYYKSQENWKNWISSTWMFQPSSQNKDLKIIILSSIVLRSVLIPSKARLFHSHQMIHIRHKGMAVQQLPLLNLPHRPVQPASKSTTRWGITHCKPNRHKPIYHNSLEYSQCHIIWWW